MTPVLVLIPKPVGKPVALQVSGSFFAAGRKVKVPPSSIERTLVLVMISGAAILSGLKELCDDGGALVRNLAFAVVVFEPFHGDEAERVTLIVFGVKSNEATANQEVCRLRRDGALF